MCKSGQPETFTVSDRDNSGHSSTIHNFRHTDTGTIPPPAIVSQLHRIQSGNFNSRSIASKRGSLRNGSKSSHTFKYCNQGTWRRIVVSSHSSALTLSPHCAQIMAYASAPLSPAKPV